MLKGLLLKWTIWSLRIRKSSLSLRCLTETNAEAVKRKTGDPRTETTEDTITTIDPWKALSIHRNSLLKIKIKKSNLNIIVFQQNLLNSLVLVCHEHDHFLPILSKGWKDILYVELNFLWIICDFDNLLELFEANIALGFHEILSHHSLENLLFQAFWGINWMSESFENLER